MINHTIIVTKCNDCPLLNKYIAGHGGLSTPITESGGRITCSCNLQPDAGSFYSRERKYDELFEKCPLKNNPITVKLK